MTKKPRSSNLRWKAFARAPHASKLIGQPHQYEPRIGDDREQHAPERIRLAGGKGAIGRPLSARAELAEPGKLTRELHGRGAVRRDRGLIGKHAARKQRLQQRARDDFAFGIERRKYRGRFHALLDGGLPCRRIRSDRVEQGAQVGQHGRAGRRRSGRRLHGEPLS
jgi:hypothetical protein